MRAGVEMFAVFARVVTRKVLASLRVPRSAFRGCAISTTIWKPVSGVNDLRSQLDAPLSNLQAFVINSALAADDVEVLAGGSGCHEPPLQINRFFETTKAAAFAGFFPICHCWGNATRMRCW